ncbi:Major facilitator superfamily domain-containing protein 8-like isoform X1 [Oopsacas minuta]|uniref:Major facilitator superfamily domain-containing protein 8-like isoform X1 n=1 Tax=Oopsacas minuta TaxID=111878 RepID=A0AAV7K594_9METZ|nr:Major facilitator superfamily domain-containing protein 8-like isoform X1 [Oopsacas minuta]
MSCDRFLRISTFLVFCSYNFLCGVEYAVVIPTLWNYISSYGASEAFYGLSLSIFSMSRLLFGPLFGYWYDKTHGLKLIVCFATLFEIGGNILYFMGFSKYSILAARFINGMGASAGGILVSELAWTIPKEKQTRIFSLFFACFQLGLLLGPGLNFFLENFDFYIGPFLINALSVPGLVMASFWTCLLLAFIIFVRSYVKRKINSDNSNNLLGVKKLNVNTEGTPLIRTKALTDSYKQNLTSTQTTAASLAESGIHPYFSWRTVGNTLFRDEFILLLALTFVTMFNQTCIETFIVPWAQNNLYWDESYLSVFYIIASIQGLISYLFVSILSQCLGDRWLMVIGLGGNALAYIVLLSVFPTIIPSKIGTHEGNVNLIKVYGTSSMIIIFLPFFFVGASSIFSKLVPPEIQGVSQGIRRSFLCLGTIMGPLWAGGNVKRPMVMGIVLEILFIVVLIMTFLSWKKLKMNFRK